MSWQQRGGHDAAQAQDHTRDAMRRRRADRWNAFARGGTGQKWTAEARWAAEVWAHCPTLVLYQNCGRLPFLCGGGGDPANLGDVAPSGLYPQALAFARAADARPQPGEVELFACLLGGLQPEDVLAFAAQAHPAGAQDAPAARSQPHSTQNTYRPSEAPGGSQ